MQEPRNRQGGDGQGRFGNASVWLHIAVLAAGAWVSWNNVEATRDLADETRKSAELVSAEREEVTELAGKVQNLAESIGLLTASPPILTSVEKQGRPQSFAVHQGRPAADFGHLDASRLYFTVENPSPSKAEAQIEIYNAGRLLCRSAAFSIPAKYFATLPLRLDANPCRLNLPLHDPDLSFKVVVPTMSDPTVG